MMGPTIAGFAVILLVFANSGRAQSPEITSVEKSGNAFTLEWIGTGANPAVVQRSISLLEGSWENVSGLSHSGSFTDWNAPDQSAFYRVMVPSAASAVEQLVLSATVAIQEDFQQEIILGSEAVGSGGNTVLYPNTPANMVPQRATGSLQSDPDFANLVRQSGTGVFPGATVLSFTSTDSTSDYDTDGQRIDPARWSAPMLSGREFSASETPRWIYVTPQGYQETISADTIGRIAFNVYDVGGLLNANASGFAPGVGGTDYSGEMHRKGSTLWADLREIPGINATAFAADDAWPPQWRLPGDWGSGANGFSLFATGPEASGPFYERTGWRVPFLNPVSNHADRMFTSRQELINYATANPGTFTPSGTLLPALQYLTHWSRWNNAPSFKHDSTRTYTKPVVGGISVGGNDYSAFSAQQAANPFFPSILVTLPFQRKTIDANGNLVDRSATEGFAKVGEPLVKYRFPLNRLKFLQRTANAVDVNSPIYWAFGLTKAEGISSPWIYSAINPSNDRIYTLAEIASLGREPNFFELLKAAIHVGSLGKASGSGATVSRDFLDGYLDLQVLRLGANLIDQYDSDSFPTIIRYPASSISDDDNFLGSGTRKWKVYGIENLPQVQGVMQRWLFTSNRNLSSSGFGGTIIMQPVLWNPHDITTYVDPGNGAPTKFRVWSSATTLQSMGVPASTANPTRSNSAVEFDANPAAFREPNLIARRDRDGINAVPIGPLASIVDDSGNEWLGAGRTEPAGGQAAPGALTVYGTNSANGLSVYLDYQDTDGTWVTYSALESVMHNGFVNGYWGYLSYFAKPDPRTQRFGSFASQLGAPHSGLNNTGLWNHIGTGFPPTSGQMASLWDVPPRGPVSGIAGWGQFNGRGSFGAGDRPMGITLNTEDATFRYTDPDGILRWGDSGFGANGMLSNEQSTRPIVLNRPFHNVGEMGHAFRDLPWKSIDFFSERSGDSALLDVFCISESPDDGLLANRVSLNAASPAVLRALMNEGLRRDAGGVNGTSASEDLISEDELNSLVDAIINTRNDAPFLNRSELVSRVMAALPLSGPSFTIKRQREALVRSLADMVETNNWNLMADVIAQTGSMRPGGTTPADFLPAEEQRRWHFFSMDRSTGRVINQTGEDVVE